MVSIPTDTVALEGAWYEPEGRSTIGAALLLHGNTMNFFTGAPRFLPPALTRLGLACLAFNRRGHDILGIRDSRAAEGAAFQTYAEAIDDNRIAAAWLAARGFREPVVIGHSNGGTLAVQHVAGHPRTPALVLLSALVFVPIHYLYPSRARFLRVWTVGLGILWTVMVFALAVAPHAEWAVPLGWISLFYPAYYVLASLAHHRRITRAAAA